MVPVEQQYPAPYEVPPGTIGVDLVHIADEVAWMESLPDVDYDPVEAGQKHEELLSGLADFKEDMQQLTDLERARMGPYIRSLVPHYFEDNVPDSKVFDALLKKDDDKFIEYLRIHAEVVEEHARDVAPLIEAWEDDFIEDVRVAIGDGNSWVSPTAIRVADSVRHADIRVGDWAITQSRFHGAYYTPSDNRSITVSQGLGATRGQRYRDFEKNRNTYVKHELFHREFEDAVDPLADAWLGESMAHHVALSFEHGQPEVLDPDLRRDGDRIYYSERKLTTTVMDGIDPALLTRATTSSKRTSREWGELDAALENKYGRPDMVSLITERVNAYIPLYVETNPEEEPHAIRSLAADRVREELESKPWVVTGIRHRRLYRVSQAIRSILEQEF